jgi:hypothetical protein
VKVFVVNMNRKAAARLASADITMIERPKRKSGKDKAPYRAAVPLEWPSGFAANIVYHNRLETMHDSAIR